LLLELQKSGFGSSQSIGFPDPKIGGTEMIKENPVSHKE
jgi:hypothetical protein